MQITNDEPVRYRIENLSESIHSSIMFGLIWGPVLTGWWKQYFVGNDDPLF